MDLGPLLLSGSWVEWVFLEREITVEMFPGVVRDALVGACGIAPGSHLVVGVSGGCDSVALLRSLAAVSGELDLRLTVAHLDHGLREASSGDAGFVRELCIGLQLPCIVETADVAGLASKGGGSIEMVARAARHALFKRVVAHQDAVGVVLAHTADDQAETLLLNLCRGSGLRGLGGMQACREVDGVMLLRPLLAARRAQLEQYLTGLGQCWHEDESNTDTRYRRNLVRHEVLPVLKQINPGVVGHLAALANQVQADEACLADQASALLAEWSGPDGGLSAGGAFGNVSLALQRRVVRQWCQQRGSGPLTAELTDQLIALAGRGEGSGRLSLGRGVLVEQAYGTLRIVDSPVDIGPHPLPVPGEVSLPALGLRLVADVAPGVVRERYDHVGQVPSAASVRLHPGRALVVRCWRPGDRMRPLGLDGSRKLQDIFSDAKVPRACRTCIPLVLCGDEVVWIPGYRIAEGWEVADSAADSIQLRLMRKE